MEGQTQVALTPPVVAQPQLLRRLQAMGRFMRTKPLGATGVVILVLATFVAAVGPTLAPYNPVRANADSILLPPSAANWFGTDLLGRDILSRTIYGTRVSLYVGVVAMLGAAISGAMLGVMSGYLGGRFDIVVQRFVDGLTAFPTLLLAMALVAAFGQSLNNVILALAVTFAPRITRVVRSVALSVRETPYIDAAKVLGASQTRIVLQHVLPNTFASLVVISTASVGTMIITEASLSFLGVGTPAHIVSWGAMLSGDIQAQFAAAPWIGIFPGVALTLVVFGINVFGDALRDILDPRLRGR